MTIKVVFTLYCYSGDGRRMCRISDDGPYYNGSYDRSDRDYRYDRDRSNQLIEHGGSVNVLKETINLA